MKNSAKTRMLVYAVIALAVMNVATFATIGYHVYRSGEGEEVQSSNQIEGDAQAYSDRYFRERLGFSADQAASFREFSPVFRQHARQINQALIDCRISMLDEMKQGDPDPGRLEMLSDSIGKLHAGLKHYTYGFYLDMKAISTPSQQEELNNMFEEFFVNDYRMGSPGAGRQQGRGFGLRRQSGNE